MWIIELEEGVWIAPWDGDPGRTLVQNNAQRFPSERGARQALRYARQYRPFVNAVARLVKFAVLFDKGVGIP